MATCAAFIVFSNDDDNNNSNNNNNNNNVGNEDKDCADYCWYAGTKLEREWTRI